MKERNNHRVSKSRQKLLDKQAMESKRRFLKSSLAVIITGTIFGSLWYFRNQGTEEDKSSGNINDIKNSLTKLNEELKRGTRSIEQSAKEVVEIATSFLSVQMQAIFPELNEQFDLDRIRSRYEIVSEQEYINISEECDRLPVTPGNAGRYINRHDKIYITPEKIWRSTNSSEEAVDILFRLVVHEGIHSTPPKKMYDTPLSFPHLNVSYDFTQGARAGIITDQTDSYGNHCDLITFANVEEFITEDTTARFLSLINPIIVQMDSNYAQGVNNYRKNILPLFGNDPNIGLKFQQNSDPFGFFRTVGRNMGVVDNNWQIAAGINYFNDKVG